VRSGVDVAVGRTCGVLPEGRSGAVAPRIWLMTSRSFVAFLGTGLHVPIREYLSLRTDIYIVCRTAGEVVLMVKVLLAWLIGRTLRPFAANGERLRPQPQGWLTVDERRLEEVARLDDACAA